MDRPGSALCDHIHRHGYQSHLFSDITVSFQGKDYKLHRIILSQSLYFRSLLSGPWKESGKPRVELKIDDHNVTVDGLETALAYLYGIAPAFTCDNAVGILGAGCFLCIENLCEECVQFMVADIREETFLGYQQLSERHCYGQHAEAIRDACWSYLCLHAARELLPVLSKLSLPLLCRLLKSDELWVANESERYKLAKEVLLDWKLSRMKTGNGDGKRQRASRSNTARKAAKTASGKAKDKSGKTSSKDKAKKDQKAASKDDLVESPLMKLRRLWEEDAAEDAAETSKDGFDMVADLFCGGGIIFTYMDATEGLQVRKELEDASMPTDVVNDAIWQNVLLKARIIGNSHRGGDDGGAASDDSDSESDPDSESDDSSSSESDDWSEGDGPEKASDDAGGRPSTATALVPFSAGEDKPFDGKRRKTTGGFSWAAKLHTGMQMSDFPPYRFGTEFKCVEGTWYPADGKTDVFFGGSRWNVAMHPDALKDAWTVSLRCRGAVFGPQGQIYSDLRKVVRYAAKLYMRTSSGLQCVTGSGKRKAKTKCDVSVSLASADLPTDKLFRVVAVVQLMDDESKAAAMDEEA